MAHEARTGRARSKPVIGLTGGIGAGKSEAARILGELGAGVIDADRLAHEELETPEVCQSLVAWWGPAILNGSGQVNRRRVARIVFADPVERGRLERLLHPRVRRRSLELTAEMDRDPRVRAVVIDAPLLMEAGLDEELCDTVVFVKSEASLRAARTSTHRGWTAEEHGRREASQHALEDKHAGADYVITNNSSLDAFRRRVERVFRQILARHRQEARG